MRLTDRQLEYFDAAVLKLDPKKDAAINQQVAYLITRLEQKMEEDSSFKVLRSFKTGSLAKGTALRPRDGDQVDADIAVYLDLEEAAASDTDRLHQIIRRLLVAIYPTKKPVDFVVQPRTLGIWFRESGLDVDLVPVVAIPGPGWYGWQPSSKGEEPVKTSIPKQLEFMKARAQADPRFRTLARMAKRWRNRQAQDFPELAELRSFAVELILAHLQDVSGPAPSLLEGMTRFFLFIAQTELRQSVTFPENGRTRALPSDPVVILDPVNSTNNAARRITEKDREVIVRQAAEVWEILHTASWNGFKGETLELWKAVFGPSFAIEE